MNHATTKRNLAAHGVLFTLAAAVGCWTALALGPDRTAPPTVSDEVTGSGPEHPHDHDDARSFAGPRAPSDLPMAGASAPEAPSAAPPEEDYHPREPEEWQGLRVRRDERLDCESKAGCNLALACIEGVCQPCRADDDCADGEACTLDHCLPAPQVACRSRRDCADGQLCFLSSYAGPSGRSNERMRAYCADLDGANPHVDNEDGDVDLTVDVPSVQFTPEELGPSHALLARLEREAAQLEPKADAADEE